MAAAIIATPLQLHYSLSRYQHYGLGIFVWGLGHIIQTIWMWRLSGKWMRIGGICGGLYLTSLGLVFYANPWLDPRVAVQTEAQENFRALIGYLYTGLTVPLMLVWIESTIESSKNRRAAVISTKAHDPRKQRTDQQ